MIHAFDTKGRSRCRQVKREGAPTVTQALYSELCKDCLGAIARSCEDRQRRRRG